MAEMVMSPISHQRPKPRGHWLFSFFLPLFCISQLERAREHQPGTSDSTGKSLFASAVRYLGISPKKNHRPPELIKFLMPAARHENKRNPAMVAWEVGGVGGIWFVSPVGKFLLRRAALLVCSVGPWGRGGNAGTTAVNGPGQSWRVLAWPSTVRSEEWPAWFSCWFSGCWR